VAGERRYYDDAYTMAFDACIAGAGEWQGRPAVELDATWFYPESGGQLGDHGTIGGAGVLDVQEDEGGRVWHVLEAGAPAPAAGPAAQACVVDWTRRFDHMQQHTGQHVLSAAFERGAGAATVSSTLGEERSVIELGLAAMDWRLAQRIEETANGVLWEDREIRLHWTDAQGAARFALRKPPVARERIRIVEIPDWDVSACGGTHTRRTGEVGTIKIVGWEKVRGNVRVSFLCGARALRDHAWRTEALLDAAKRRTIRDRELIAHLERASDERDRLAKQLRGLAARALAAEASARVGDPPRGVAEWARARRSARSRSPAWAPARRGC